jgi:2-dehydropantoate 2-reductase
MSVKADGTRDAAPYGLRHGVLGAGGVGGLLGTCLAYSGSPVSLVVRREALDRHPRQLHLESVFGTFEAGVSVVAALPPVDVLWIAVKATQLESALASIRDPGALQAVVPLLNGIDHVALLREKYGPDLVIPATIGVETERVSPGHFVHRSPFCRLSVSSRGRSLLSNTLDQLQQIGFECRFVDDEPTLMWSKLVFLAPFALITTAADKASGEFLSNSTWRSAWEACVRETCTVARAEGAKVGPEPIMAFTTALPANTRSSMQKDVEQHNTPELDAIAGPILRGADRHQIDVSTTRKLVAAIEQRAELAKKRPA